MFDGPNSPTERYRRDAMFRALVDTLEMHTGAVGPGDVVLIIDDVLATGGTAAAKAELVTGSGALVADYAFLIELDFLRGRAKLGDQRIVSLIHVA